MGPIEQFNIVSYARFFSVDFTNAALAMAVSTVCIAYFLWVLPHVSNTFRVLADLYYDFIDDLASKAIGHGYEFLVPFISTVFLFILFSNWIGLIPGFFTPTSHMSTNVVISGTVILGVLLLAMFRHGARFIRLFVPSGVPFWLVPLITPIEIASFAIRIFSLAIRLCINMCVGHIMFKVFLMLAAKLGIFGAGIGVVYIPFFALELCVGVLQAYIFTILTCVYLRDAVELH